MERKNQNLEFSQKSSAECLEKQRSHCLYAMARGPTASGGDIASKDKLSAKNSSCRSFKSASDIYDGEQSDDSHYSKSNHSDGRQSAGESLKQNLNGHRRRNGNKYADVGAKLKSELSKYKKELIEYNSTTKDLEDQYKKINYELNELQQKHDQFRTGRKVESELSFSDSSCSTGSEFALKRKYTQVFNRGSGGHSSHSSYPKASTHRLRSQSSNENLNESFHSKQSTEHERMQKKRKQSQSAGDYVRKNSNSSVSSKKGIKRKSSDNKENHAPRNISSNHQQPPGLKDVYKVLKTVLDTNQKSSMQLPHSKGGIDLREMQTTINSLQSEQEQFRSIIQQQQNCLHDYHSRCVKAHHIMQTQKREIEKLNSNNQQLETEITSGIDQLRIKIDSKLRDISHLPQVVREEQNKYEKMSKENNVLSERLRVAQNQAAELKLKIEELGRRKSTTINRLKAAERDLKIFKNYNTALKHEKRKLGEELQKVKEQLDSVQNASKRTLSRQREQSEKQRRDLQKRVFELELKLSRSQNSTTGLIQERDSLIAELQSQLNTLVHNFEVSQKHIRVLRRHIYSMSGTSNNHSNSRIMRETA